MRDTDTESAYANFVDVECTSNVQKIYRLILVFQFMNPKYSSNSNIPQNASESSSELIDFEN